MQLSVEKNNHSVVGLYSMFTGAWKHYKVGEANWQCGRIQNM